MTKTIILLLVIGFLFLGCTGPAEPSQNGATDVQNADELETSPSIVDESPAAANEETEAEAESVEESAYDDSESTEVGTSPGETKILLLGRSVAYYWTEYMGLEWTCDDEDCNIGSPRGSYNGYYITYYELEYPPDIATSAARGADAYGQDADVVFFKFCFVDFAADDSLQNARDNEALVEDVYQYIVVERGKKLIIGNALPQVRADTESALVANQREFNSWLASFAATHDDVQVLDLYGTLADSSGALKPEYAIASDDSHITAAAYDKITPKFFALVESS